MSSNVVRARKATADALAARRHHLDQPVRSGECASARSGERAASHRGAHRLDVAGGLVNTGVRKALVDPRNPGIPSAIPSAIVHAAS